MLLRAAVSLYLTFQPVLLSKFTCCVPTLVGIRRSRADSETLAVDLKGQTALLVIVGLPAQVGFVAAYLASRFLSAVLYV